MLTKHKSAQNIRIDERNHDEKPLLDQLAGRGGRILQGIKL
jgi:hypothetical protein